MGALIRKITSVLKVLDRYSGLRMDVGSNYITLSEPYHNFHMGSIAYDEATEFVEVEINMTVCDRRTGQPVRTAADHMRSNEWRLDHKISIPQNKSYRARYRSECTQCLKSWLDTHAPIAFTACIQHSGNGEPVKRETDPVAMPDEQSLPADYCSYCYESGGSHSETCTQKGS